MFTIVVVVGLTHIIVYLSYPDTTAFGLGYLLASNLLWICFFMLLNFSIRNLKEFTQYLIRFITYFIMLFITLSYYPQIDGKSVYDKIIDGKYPNRYSFYRGLRRFGIK
jgi:hypothetical protein